MSLNIIKKLKDIIFKKLYLNFLLSDFFFSIEKQIGMLDFLFHLVEFSEYLNIFFSFISIEVLLALMRYCLYI